MNPLQNLLLKVIQVTTNDGRVFVGVLKGIDDILNTVLTNTLERVFSENETMQEIDLGLYFIRGDTIVCIGEVDEEKETDRNL